MKLTRVKPASPVLLLVALVFASFAPILAGAQEYREAYNAGLEAAKARSYAEAVSKFQEAAAGAESAGDSEVARKSRYVAAQLVNRLGNTAYKAEKYETALSHYAEGVGLYPDYIKNRFGQGRSMMKTGRVEEGLDALKEVADASGDRKTSLAAGRAIREHFHFQASSALSRPNALVRDAERALAALAMIEEYLEPDADYHYYMAEAQRIRGEHQESLASADRALALHKGTRADKARIWYVKAQALHAIGDIDAAKEAFTNAAFGRYRQSAQDYLSRL